MRHALWLRRGLDCCHRREFQCAEDRVWRLVQSTTIPIDSAAPSMSAVPEIESSSHASATGQQQPRRGPILSRHRHKPRAVFH